MPSRSNKPARPAFWLEPLDRRFLLASTVNFNDVRQSVDGFGSETTWGENLVLSDTLAEQLYSQTTGIGLSVVRGSINANGTSHQVAWDQKAQRYGVTLIKSPRGPAVAWLTNSGDVNTGELDPGHYQDYANMVADFLQNSAAQGNPIAAVSMAVEPDLVGEIMPVWNGEQFAALLPYFANTFRSRGITTKIMGNEDVGWTFANAGKILADPDLAQYFDIVAGHGYAQSYSPYGAVTNAMGKPIWMTENIVNGDGLTEIEHANKIATDIHRAFEISGVNLYAYYWPSFLMNGSTPLKGFWALGNFSRFVRPGWVMVGDTTDSALQLTTFKDPASGKFAIVVNNPGTTAITDTFMLSGLAASSVIPYVTSSTDNLAAKASIPIAGGLFSATIGAGSVVTFYGVSSSALTLQAPTGLKVAPNVSALTTQMALSWTDNSSSETGYTVERSTNETAWTVVTSTLAANTTSYIDTGRSEATTYHYRVKANNGAGGSAYSALATGKTILAAPNSLSVAVGAAGNTLTWARGSAVNTGVVIQRSLDGLTWTTIATSSSNITSYADTITGYNAKRIYSYRVRNTYSGAESGYAQANTTVRVPTGFAASSVDPTSVTLTWANDAVGAYAAYIRKDNRAISPPNLPANAGAYTVAGLAENTTYSFQVAALGPDSWYRGSIGVFYGARSAYSTISVTTPVAKVSGLVAVTTVVGTATLSWLDNSSIETAYQIERSVDGANWTVLTTTLAANASSYIDSTAPTSGSVYYRVRAATGTANSAYVSTQLVSAAPTIQTAPTVTGKTTSLIANAPSNFGGGTLSYLWTVDGPPDRNVTFSANGTNAARTTTATFAAAGTYVLRVTIGDASGRTTSAAATITVAQTTTAITVEDIAARASYGGKAAATPAITRSTWQQLVALAYDQFGTPLAPQPTFTWAVTGGGGSVSSSGLYTAPASAGTTVVRASVGAVVGQINLRVVDTPELVAGYGFNETSGYSLDGIGTANLTAKASGGTTFAAGRLGGAVRFDGSNGSVYIGQDSVVDIRGQITMSAWVKPESTGGTQTIVSRGYNQWPNFSGTFLRIANGQYQVGYYDSAYRMATSAMPVSDVGQWVHLAGTFDGKTWNLYRNGSRVATYTATRGATYAAKAWRVGSSDFPNGYFNGTIDSIRLYGQAMSASDVSALYQQGIVLTSPATAISGGAGGNTAFLSVAAIDPDSSDDSRFTYTWTTTAKPGGAADPVLVTNGTNAAKNTGASLSAPGTYVFTVTISDPSGKTTTSSASVFIASGDARTPTVVRPASASPAAVTGTTAALSVLGTDDGGESNLVYEWSVSGPAPVTFLANGTNAAKDTTAVFTAAGSYTFIARIVDGTGRATGSAVSVTVVTTLTTIGVTPTSTTVEPGSMQQLTAVGRDQFGSPMSSSFAWSIASGNGSVGASGLFTAAGDRGGLVAVRATSGSVSGTAVLSVPMDNSNASGVTYTGTWVSSTTVGAWYGTNYSYSNTAGSTATYSTPIPVTGLYAVYARWPAFTNRSSSVPYEVATATGTVTVNVDQQQQNGAWVLLGNYSFSAGTIGAATIRRLGSETGSTVADGVKFELSQAAPVIVQAAGASPSPVPGNTANLFVRANDDAGESALTYTWSIVTSPAGAAVPAFSANGSNAAKNALVRFAKAGAYTLRVTIADSGGLSTTSDVTVNVTQTATSVAVTPATANVATGGSLQLSAKVHDQFGDEVASAPMTWSVDAGGFGSVSSAGLFTATSSTGVSTIRATSGALSGTAVVTTQDTTAPTLIAAASRKSHGSAGSFDLSLDLASSAGSVEPRTGGVTGLVFDFSEPVRAGDGTLSANDFVITGGTFMSATTAGNKLVLVLSGVSNLTKTYVNLNGVTDLAGNAVVGDRDILVRNLQGDINRSGMVTGADQLIVKNNLLVAVSAASFLSDLNLSGSVTGADQLIVKNQLLDALT